MRKRSLIKTGCSGCLKILFAVFALVFLVAMLAVANHFAIEPWRSMARLRRAVPQAIETFEKSRERLDVIANGEFAQSGLIILLDSSLLREGIRAISRVERLDVFPEEERDALLFLMTGEELGERGFARIIGRDGVIRADVYRQGNVSMNAIEINRGRCPSDRGVSVVHRYVADLGGGYELWLDVVRSFSDWGTWMLVAFAVLAGIATFLLSLPLIWGRIRKRRNEER